MCVFLMYHLLVTDKCIVMHNISIGVVALNRGGLAQLRNISALICSLNKV